MNNLLVQHQQHLIALLNHFHPIKTLIDRNQQGMIKLKKIK